ncbi:TniB family NTP-binding protein [Variovorax sp. HJSM1_2]|uniref:TniB family NTP-binding protein n=1 Tax=Variovorax sp. HJSM1_2 TaxID=3366263 RepID=UPI003BE014B3
MWRDIESCELPHPMFMKHAQALQQYVEDALAGCEPKVTRVPGPSGVGKSSLIATLARAYPMTRVNGRLQAPVLIVRVPSLATEKQLPACVLESLGLTVPGSQTGRALLTMMLEQLKLAGTRMVIFDEISHLVDEGSRVPPRAASDWLKSLLDRARVALMMCGIPRLERLFSSNEQLRRRSRPKREFLPYDACDAEQMKAYIACVTSYARMFSAAGYPISVPPRVLTQQTYLLTGGLIGVLSDFMRELARRVTRDAPRAVTYTDCQMVLEEVSHAGSPHLLAFQDSAAEDMDVPAAALKQAYVHVLTTNSTQVPMRKKSGGK